VSSRVDELEKCDVVVESSAQFNGDATNDGRTSDGIGTEFGPWGREYVVVNPDSVGAPRPEATSSIRSNPWSAIVRPDGQTAGGVERIAGREAELKRLHERYYVPAYDGGLIDAAKRDDITQRVAERARESRAAPRRRAFATRGRPAFDVYEDTAERRQARAAAMRHRAWGAASSRHRRTAVPTTPPRGASIPAYGRRGMPTRTAGRRRRSPDPRRRRHRRRSTPTLTPSRNSPFGRLRPLNPETIRPIARPPGRRRRRRPYRANAPARPSARQAAVRHPWRPAVDAHRRQPGAVSQRSRSLEEFEPFWPAATARVRVERLIDADHLSIDQVVYVSDVSPRVDRASTGS
jgi:hypothetical protein